MSVPRLTMICTDKGAHPVRTLGFLQFLVGRDLGVVSPSGAVGPSRYLIGDELARYLLDPVWGPPWVMLSGSVGGARTNRHGRMKPHPNKKEKDPTGWTNKRTDTRTFNCRTCGRMPRVAADDLTKLAAHWPSDVLDISQIDR